MEVREGLNYSMMEKLKKDMKFDNCTAVEKMVGIMMDEMKINAGLVFDKGGNRIVGFVNLGSVNDDLDALKHSLAADDSAKQKPELAGSMYVLMITMLQRPSFTFPIAEYPASSLSGEKMYPIVWEAIEALEINDLKVMSISCDGLSANRKFFKIGRGEDISAAVPFKTVNPFEEKRCLYYFCDASHLLKTTRNCLSNSFSHSCSRKLKVSMVQLFILHYY